MEVDLDGVMRGLQYIQFLQNTANERDLAFEGSILEAVCSEIPLNSICFRPS